MMVLLGVLFISTIRSNCNKTHMDFSGSFILLCFVTVSILSVGQYLSRLVENWGIQRKTQLMVQSNKSPLLMLKSILWFVKIGWIPYFVSISTMCSLIFHWFLDAPTSILCWANAHSHSEIPMDRPVKHHQFPEFWVFPSCIDFTFPVKHVYCLTGNYPWNPMHPNWWWLLVKHSEHSLNFKVFSLEGGAPPASASQVAHGLEKVMERPGLSEAPPWARWQRWSTSA